MDESTSNIVIDTKIRDTSADQVLRFFLRFINSLWTLLLVLSVWPVGLLWAAGSIYVMIKLDSRRKARYSNNAYVLSQLNTYPRQAL